MERDSLISHGVSQFLKERLMECSDQYSFYVCELCGFIATKMKDKDVHYCQNCNNSTEIAKVQCPFAFKLLIQEMSALNLAARIRVKKDEKSIKL